ncbi:HD-GYP domain-containing protein [Fervidobacterium gondwanense]|uniref:HD-GYP domain-containing protein n=1 Tax=Fervidobacterium gondwanense TaxID=44754 RepID=UPI0009330C14|nr:HD domain-containing phosphohydrolase [Fervidobacterium gondwanense]
MEKIVKEAPEMNLSELLINAFFQIRTFLSLRDSKLNITSEIFVNGERIFPPKNIRVENHYLPNQYNYKINIKHNAVKFSLYTSRDLKAFESAYVNSLLKNIESAFVQKEGFDVEDEFVLMISKLVEARSEETGEHVNRVSEIAKFLAQLSGHSSRDVKLIHGAAALHDIGKVGIPDYILNKPAKLDDKEFAIMKEHTLIGFELLRNSSLKIFQTGAVIALEHHERWDGTGYPYGLEGEQITLESRIVQIADVFEALTQDRCYRPAWPLEKAIEYMNDMKGKQFDPWLIELFNKHLREFVQIVQDKQDEEAN